MHNSHRLKGHIIQDTALKNFFRQYRHTLIEIL